MNVLKILDEVAHILVQRECLTQERRVMCRAFFRIPEHFFLFYSFYFTPTPMKSLFCFCKINLVITSILFQIKVLLKLKSSRILKRRLHWCWGLLFYLLSLLFHSPKFFTFYFLLLVYTCLVGIFHKHGLFFKNLGG